MNKIAKTYLVEKLKRTEIKDAAINVLRSKEGIHIDIGGRGVELIEIAAYVVGSLSKMSGVSFEIIIEEYKRRITEYHHLQGDRIYKFCSDCGKLLDSEFCTWEELKLRFEEYR